MATRSTASTKTTKPAAAKAAPATKAAEKPVEAAEVQTPVKARDVDLHEYIPVKNGFQGILVYVSKRTGETFTWEHFGDEQEMELQELKNAKASSKVFFQKNWFMFDGEYSWVPEYLGVSAYYKNALQLDEFDDVFTMPPDEIFERVSQLSEGQKTSLMYRARHLIAENEVDSNRVIAALEDALGVKLSER